MNILHDAAQGVALLLLMGLLCSCFVVEFEFSDNEPLAGTHAPNRDEYLLRKSPAIISTGLQEAGRVCHDIVDQQFGSGCQEQANSR